MADNMMRMAGRGDDGLAKAILTDNTGVVKTAPTGNAVEELIVFNEIEIRDTIAHDVVIDLSKYRSVTFITRNMMDKGVSILFRPYSRTAKVWNGTEFVELKATLSETERYFTVILNSVLPELNNNFKTMQIRIQCAVAPTAETFTLYALGELR